MKLNVELISFLYLAFFILLLVDDQGGAHSYGKPSTGETDGAGEHRPDLTDPGGKGDA